MPGKNVPAIKVNTVGYEVGWKKIAIFNVEPKNAVLKDAQPARSVLAIEPKQVTAKGTDAASQDPVWQVDFSAFDKPGQYKLASGRRRERRVRDRQRACTGRRWSPG